jgi:hypothetical protein
MTCNVEGCTEVVYSKKNGLCHRHWHANRKGKLDPWDARAEAADVLQRWDDDAPLPELTEDTDIPANIKEAFSDESLTLGVPVGRKTVLVDDLDGTELPEDTAPITLSLGRTTYALYLTDKNHEKLLKAVTPFIENAEKVSGTGGSGGGARATRSVGSGDKEKMKAVRAWAQSTGYKFKAADGSERTLGDRGRIPQEVVDAYDAAN